MATVKIQGDRVVVDVADKTVVVNDTNFDLVGVREIQGVITLRSDVHKIIFTKIPATSLTAVQVHWVEDSEFSDAVSVQRRTIYSFSGDTNYGAVREWVRRHFIGGEESPPWVELTDAGLLIHLPVKVVKVCRDDYHLAKTSRPYDEVVFQSIRRRDFITVSRDLNRLASFRLMELCGSAVGEDGIVWKQWDETAFLSDVEFHQVDEWARRHYSPKPR